MDCMTNNAEKDNWLKKMGVDAGCTGSMMCPLHEHHLALVIQESREQAKYLMREIETVTLILDNVLEEKNKAMDESHRHRREARHWKNVAGLALTALAGVFVLAVYMGAK